MAVTYNMFSPGGALSGTWNSQNVNLAAGSPFIAGTLPDTNLSANVPLINAANSFSTGNRFDSIGVGVAAPAFSGSIVTSTTITAGGNVAANSGATVAGSALTVNSSIVNNGNYTGIGSLINSSGNNSSFLVGTSTSLPGASSLSQFKATGSQNAGTFYTDTTNAHTAVFWNSATSGNNDFVAFVTEGSITVRGSVSYNRAAGLISYNTTSASRFKENIRDADPSGQLIDKIRIRQYDFKESHGHVTHWVIAEELAEDFPLASNGEAVDVTKLVPLMLKEIQSLRLRVRDLEAQAQTGSSSRTSRNEIPHRDRLPRDFSDAHSVLPVRGLLPY